MEATASNAPSSASQGSSQGADGTVPSDTFAALVKESQAIYDRMHQRCADNDWAMIDIVLNGRIPEDLADMLKTRWNPLSDAVIHGMFPTPQRPQGYPCNIVADMDDKRQPAFAIMMTLICLFFTWNEELQTDEMGSFYPYRHMAPGLMEYAPLPIAFYGAYHNSGLHRPTCVPRRFQGDEWIVCGMGHVPCLILREAPCAAEMVTQLVQSAQAGRQGDSSAPIVYWHLQTESQDGDKRSGHGRKTEWVHDKVILVTGTFDLKHLLSLLEWGPGESE